MERVAPPGKAECGILGDRKFGVRVSFFNGSNFVNSVYESFNPDCGSDWQYVSAAAVALVTYSCKILNVGGSMAATLGIQNPFRYRGYVYDQETGLYYLQSRYFDPELGRFISADSYASTGQGLLGCNMFAYCNNTPVNCVDIGGCSTVGIGVDVTLAFGIRVGVSAQIVYDDSNIGLLVIYSGGGGTPAASLSIIGSSTSADTINDLQGFGCSAGASGIIGGDVTAGKAQNGDTVYGAQASCALASAPVPEAHAEVTYSVLYSLDWLPKCLKKLVINELLKQINRMS